MMHTYNLFNKDIETIFHSTGGIIHTLNPHSYCVALKDEIFQKALVTSDYLIADGIGIVLAERILFGNKTKKITGSDIHQEFLKFCNKNCLRVFYLGSTPRVLDLIEKKYKQNIPRLR